MEKPKHIETVCKEICACCKNRKSYSGFQKIIDWNEDGFILYRHTNRIDEVNKTTGQLESSVKATDDVFIIQNTKDMRLKPHDVSEMVGNVSCPRCRELVQRAQKYLKNTPNMEQKVIMSMCDHCRTKKQSQNVCHKCQKVVEKFLAERKKQSVSKQKIKEWVSKVQDIIKYVSISDKSGNLLNIRAHSESSLHNLSNQLLRTTRHLDIIPVVQTRVRISESIKSFDECSIKSESALMFMDSKTKKSNKDNYLSSSKRTPDTESVRVKKELNLKGLLKNIFKRENDYEQKNAQEKAHEPLKKYYSEEDVFLSSADLGHRHLHEIFSYVFPKKVTEDIVPLRRVKTSAELIVDTKEMLRLRELAKSNQGVQIQKLKQKKILSIIEQGNLKKKTTVIADDLESLGRAQTSNELTGDTKAKQQKLTSITPDEQDNLVQKKSKESGKSGGPSSKVRDKERTKTKDVKAEKQDKDKISDKKNQDKPKLRRKENTDEMKKDKEDKKRVERENKERIKQEKEELKKREKEQKQKLKEEKFKVKNDQHKDFEKQSKKNDDGHAANIQSLKQQEEGNKRFMTEADKKTREDTTKRLQENDKQTNHKSQEKPSTKELNISQVKVRKPSPDDLILRLVKLRQSGKKNEVRPQRLSELNVSQLMIKEHKIHKNRKSLTCAICIDSDLELDVENIINKEKSEAVTDIIVGTTILKSKLPLTDKSPAEEMVPILYKSLFKEDVEQTHENVVIDHDVPEKTVIRSHTPLSNKYTEQELPKGVTRYALSDRSFIDKGWTMLPTEKVVRKMNVYRMRPAHPEFDWFDRNKNKRLILYDSGEKLAEFDDNGRGRWFYRNGKLALDYYDAEEMNAQQRIVIYGSGEPDERGRYQPAAILATFDYLGNGVVFDHTGKIRLKYNQTEGVVLDRSIGPVSHWKWHTLNDPPVLQQVMIDTQMAHKDPDILKLGGPADEKIRPDNEEMLAIEFDNFIKEKSKKLSQKFKPFQIRTKALKINEHFSLRVLDQANIYLIYRDGTTNIKMNIGMILDHHEIVDTDTAEVGEVSNSLERFPARTDSLAGLQRSVAFAQRVERLRVERDRRLRHPEPSSSADRLVAAASRPLRQRLQTVPSSTISAGDVCQCKCRKPSVQNMYYDTRLM